MSLSTANGNQSSSVAAIKRKLDSLRKARLLAEADDFHEKPKKSSIEDDVFGSELFFDED